MRWQLALGFMFGVAFSQTPPDTVRWNASLSSSAIGETTLQISGDIQDGWHVYALTQPSGGPIALKVTVDENEIARSSGAPTGPKPHMRLDPSFKLRTQFYTHSFTLRLPLQLKQPAAAGEQHIPVSVRFQTCSDRECQPPRTIHLSVPINVQS